MFWIRWYLEIDIQIYQFYSFINLFVCLFVLCRDLVIKTLYKSRLQAIAFQIKVRDV